MVLALRPHIERRDGLRFHTDRFDVLLDGGVICTSRQPRLGAARALLARGYRPDTLVNTRHEGGPLCWGTARPIGELARWRMTEDRNGLSRRPWRPFDTSAVPARRGQNTRSEVAGA